VINPLKVSPMRRRLLVAIVALPLLITAAVLVFAWPAGRISPRNVPVGLVGTSPATQRALNELTVSQPGGFSFRLYADTATARAAIRSRRVYGAFVVTPESVTVLKATAASPAVAQLLDSAGKALASGIHARLTSVDVVPEATGDPRGLVLSSALLPLTICSILVAAVLELLLERVSAVRRLASLIGTAVVGGLGAYLIAQGILGALPRQPVQTWAALSLALLAIGSTTAGLVALAGPPGLGVSAALMVFIGNPFSGVTSAPQLLPAAVDHIGQLLPPGAGASLVRNTAYFGGSDCAGHIAVLALWSVFGLGAVLLARRSPGRLAAPARPAITG
jgi:hypothetical protein